MGKNTEFANDILELLGGANNIATVTHCATRLRPTVKDNSKMDLDGLKALKGIIGVVAKDAGPQLIIGTHVGEVHDEFVLLLDKDVNKEGEIDLNTGVKDTIFNQFVSTVVAIFSPLLPLLAGSGLIRGFTILANELGWLAVDSQTNMLLTLLATSVFYFLPLLVALTASKRFKTSPYIAIAVMGTLMMPDFVKLMQVDGLESIKYFGLTIPLFSYTGQILPAIIITWIQSKMESLMNKNIPSSLHMIVIPTVLLFVLLPLAAGLIGPIGNYLSIAIANIVSAMVNFNQIITGAVIGGVWNILIMFGVHWAPNTMVIIPEIAATGQSPLIAYGATANFGMAGAAFAIFLKSRNQELKVFSLTAITSVFLSGIVEPAIYGLGVRFKSPLVAGCLGAAMGGAFMGAFNVVGNAFVFGGLTTIPAFAGPTLWAYIVGIIIAFLGGMLLTFAFGITDPEAEMN